MERRVTNKCPSTVPANQQLVGKLDLRERLKKLSAALARATATAASGSLGHEPTVLQKGACLGGSLGL